MSWVNGGSRCTAAGYSSRQSMPVTQKTCRQRKIARQRSVLREERDDILSCCLSPFYFQKNLFGIDILYVEISMLAEKVPYVNKHSLQLVQVYLGPRLHTDTDRRRTPAKQHTQNQPIYLRLSYSMYRIDRYYYYVSVFSLTTSPIIPTKLEPQKSKLTCHQKKFKGSQITRAKIQYVTKLHRISMLLFSSTLFKSERNRKSIINAMQIYHMVLPMCNRNSCAKDMYSGERPPSCTRPSTSEMRAAMASVPNTVPPRRTLSLYHR